MTQMIIPILTFVAVTAIGGAILTGRAARRQRLRLRLETTGDLTLPDPDESAATPNPLARLLETIGRRVTPASGAAELRQRLQHAGFFGPGASMIYTGIRTLTLIIGLLVTAALVWPLDLMLPARIMMVLGGGFIVSLIPSLVVDLRRNARATEIQHALPDAVDLLEICVTAGMGLDMAWNAVSDEVRRVSPVLADEMALTNLEIHLGADRASAMRHMAQRTGSEQINALVGTLVQSERFGTALAEALKVFAESMREAREARAAEAAEKMGLKMLFPMIAFILPAILIVMGGAAVIKIIHMFNQM